MDAISLATFFLFLWSIGIVLNQLSRHESAK